MIGISYRGKETKRLVKLAEHLPTGSGINLTWECEDKDLYAKCENSFQVMNRHGFYVGWADFSIIVPWPHLLLWRLHFHGKQPQYLNQRYGIREYLDDVIHTVGIRPYYLEILAERK